MRSKQEIFIRGILDKLGFKYEDVKIHSLDFRSMDVESLDQ